MKNLALQKPPNVGNMLALVEEAKLKPRINAYSVDQTRQTLLYVFALIGLSGSTLPDEGQKMVLIDYMHREMKGYSLLDVKNAFTLYVQKKLDYTEKHFYNFSVMLLENVMQSYKRYCISIPTYSRPALPQKTEPTHEEQQKIIHDGAINCFVRYARTGILRDNGNATYNYVTRKGLLRLTDERKWEYFNKAKENLIQSTTVASLTGKLSEKLAVVLKRLNDGTDTAIKSEAKRLSLAAWFDELIEMETELKDIICQ